MDETERQKEIERLTQLLERPVKANLANRAIYRWFLEFLRNCMVVAALFYAARRSGDWWLYGIAGLAALALAAYCYTYIENGWWQLEMTKAGWFSTKRGWLKHFIILASAVALQLMVMGIKRWSHFLTQPAKVGSPMQRTTHHEDAETVFG